MSIQSDVEMLFMQTAERYAKDHNLSGEEIIKLFRTHQVYEKMLIQHEFLHQVNFEETVNYVEQIMQEESKELVVYHGSCYDFDKVDLSKSHDRRDFGKGFYTTILKPQSKEWAYRLSLRKRTEKYFVYKFLFMENPVLNIKRFDRMNKEWLEFVKENRIRGGLAHNYDIVIGPVADDKTMETLQLYIADILKAEEAVERLTYSKVSNQISFHTKKALDFLRFAGREVYE